MQTIAALLLQLTLLWALTHPGYAEDDFALDTIVIRGNRELPKIIYIVPWQKDSAAGSREEQKFVLHSLFGDLFDPMLPEEIAD